MPVHEKQRFLRLVLKSASWQDRRLRTEFEELFESVRRSNRLSRTKHKENRMPNVQNEIWLGGRDSNFSPLINSPNSHRRTRRYSTSGPSGAT
jgi:hypothetical protein